MLLFFVHAKLSVSEHLLWAADNSSKNANLASYQPEGIGREAWFEENNKIIIIFKTFVELVASPSHLLSVEFAQQIDSHSVLLSNGQ